MSPWNAAGAEEVILELPDGNSRRLPCPVEASQLKDIAKELKLSTFIVKDSEGNEIEEEDFPITESETLKLERYETPAV